jgi:hypothetical protein
VCDYNIKCRYSDNRASGQQGQELKMINHPNRGLATGEDLRAGYVHVGKRIKSGELYPEPTARDLDLDSLRRYFAVHWDSKQVCFTAHHQEVNTPRMQAGREVWFPIHSVLPVGFWEDWRGAHDGSPDMGSLDSWMKKARREAEKVIAEVGREAQAVLDSTPDAEEVTEEIRLRVVSILQGHGQAA